MKVLIVLAALAAVAFAGQRRYDGYQLYEVKARDAAGYEALVKIANESDNYDFWTQPRGLDRTIDIMVPPAFASRFVAALNAFNIHYRIKIADVQKVLEESMKDVAPTHRLVEKFNNRQNGKAYSVTWDKYYDHPDIMKFVDEIKADFPNLVTVTERGTSPQGRRMPMVKISSGNAGNKAIFVDGAIHAREWISPAFTTWLINELTVNYNNHKDLVDKVDWYIMPVINPDGYAYTFAANGDRLWRKNRDSNPGSPCLGTDLNRNFGFHWDEGGSSDVPCSDTYNGASGFSEVESRIVRDAINSVKNNTMAYLTFHSYGQYWLCPWGYTAVHPTDYDELMRVANLGLAAIKAVSGTVYTAGTSTEVLYVASGGSDDWAKGDAGIKYSYTLEMRDEGRFGFQLPAAQILPNNLEVFEGVKVVANLVAGQSRSNLLRQNRH